MGRKKLLLLNKDFVFEGSKETFKDQLKTVSASSFWRKHYTLKPVSGSRFLVKKKISVGVGIISGLFHQPIDINILITPSKENKSVVKILTYYRWEHILIIVSMIIFSIFFFMQNSPINYTPFLIALSIWPITHFWFQYVYFLQQEHLMNIVKKDLKLKPLIK